MTKSASATKTLAEMSDREIKASAKQAAALYKVRHNTATPAERKVVADLLALFDDAKGEHEALAEVRRQVAAHIDITLDGLRSHGVDTDALLDEIEGV